MKQELLDGCIDLLQRDGYDFSGRELADAIGCAPGLIGYHYGSLDALKTEAIAEGCKRRVSRIILIGLVRNHKVALSLPDRVKSTAARGTS